MLVRDASRFAGHYNSKRSNYTSAEKPLLSFTAKVEAAADGSLVIHAGNEASRWIPEGGLVFREAISATLARGGRARNVVPDLFELNVNFRFAPQGTPGEAVERAAQDGRFMISIPYIYTVVIRDE